MNPWLLAALGVGGFFVLRAVANAPNAEAAPTRPVLLRTPRPADAPPHIVTFVPGLVRHMVPLPFVLQAPPAGTTAQQAIQQAGAPTIRVLQTQLAALGFDPGAVDGVYGPATQAALRAFVEAAPWAGAALNAQPPTPAQVLYTIEHAYAARVGAIPLPAR